MPHKGHADQIGDRDRLEHMLEAARDAVHYIKGRTRHDLNTDSMLLRALVQCVEVIGEAAARTTEVGRLKAPRVPWPKIVGMRHILVHAYYDIDVDAVWRVVVDHLPAMVQELNLALQSWDIQ